MPGVSTSECVEAAEESWITMDLFTLLVDIIGTLACFRECLELETLSQLKDLRDKSCCCFTASPSSSDDKRMSDSYRFMPVTIC